jgi:hypothetical protein
LIELVGKYSDKLGKTPKILLTGGWNVYIRCIEIIGMVQCPGLVDRLKLEMKEVNVEICVEEHYVWHGVSKNAETFLL